MLDGKRIAILVEEDFEDSELIEPLRSMKNAGARVVIVGTGTSKTTRASGATPTSALIPPPTGSRPRNSLPLSYQAATPPTRCAATRP